MSEDNYIFTIGRQLGAGGAELGGILARRFGFNYIDREILVKASYRMEMTAKSLEQHDEKHSIWQGFDRVGVCEPYHMPPTWYLPTENRLFEEQTGLLKQAAEESSCVIVGRCASYIFEHHPRMISIFLHADDETRMKRLEASGKVELFGENTQKAIAKEDRDRSRYFKCYTGRDWFDIRAYDLCLDTGKIDIETASQIVAEYACKRFPELRRYYCKKD